MRGRVRDEARHASRSRTCGSTSRTATACAADAEEDAAAPAAGRALAAGRAPPGRAAAVRRPGQGPSRRAPGAAALRTLDLVVSAAVRAGGLPRAVRRRPAEGDAPGARSTALVARAASGWRRRTAWPPGALRFELQVETPQAVVGPDGAATVAAADPRRRPAGARACTTAPTTTAPRAGVAGRRAVAGAPARRPRQGGHAGRRRRHRRPGQRRVDERRCRSATPRRCTPRGGCTRGSSTASLRRGFYQGWDLHPASCVTRYAATYAFLRAELAASGDRLRAYVGRAAAGVLDEPATAQALAPTVLRGLDCGAFDQAEASRRSGLDRAALGRLVRREALIALLDLVFRARRVITAVGEVDARDRRQGRDDRRDRAARRAAGGRARGRPGRGRRCCCPGWWTPTCTSTSPAAPSGRASRPRPARRRPAASRRSSTCRSTAIPPTTTLEALQLKRKAAAGSVYVDVGFWGGAVPGNLADLRGAARRGRVRLQVLPAALRRRRVPAPHDRRAGRRRCALVHAFGALLIVHAEDSDAIDRAPRAHRRAVPRLPRLPAARRRERARSRRSSSWRGGPARGCTSCTCRRRTRCR